MHISKKTDRDLIYYRIEKKASEEAMDDIKHSVKETEKNGSSCFLWKEKSCPWKN